MRPMIFSCWLAFVWASSSSPSSFFLFLVLHTLSSKDSHCFGIQAMDSCNRLCLATLLDMEVTNPMEYEFNFQLEIRGPCLLAGERKLPRHRKRDKEDWSFRLKAIREMGSGEGVTGDMKTT